MYASGTRSKEIDGQILQNRWFERSITTHEKVLLICITDKPIANTQKDKYYWVRIFKNKNEIQLIRNEKFFVSYLDKTAFFEDWRFVVDD